MLRTVELTRDLSAQIAAGSDVILPGVSNDGRRRCTSAIRPRLRCRYDLGRFGGGFLDGRRPDAIGGAFFVEEDSEHAIRAVSQPGIDFVHRLGQLLLELSRLGAKDRRHPRTGASEQAEKCRKNYGDAESARNTTALQPIRALGKRQTEQNPEEKEEDDGVRGPQQPNQNVEAENDCQYADDVACRWQAQRLPDLHVYT